VELLPESIQQQVREGAITAQVAMKYLVLMARVNAENCARMAAAFLQYRCDTRQAGQLYAAWRDGSRVVRERIFAEPEPVDAFGSFDVILGAGFDCVRTDGRARNAVNKPTFLRLLDDTPLRILIVKTLG
jgi:hypothetical protein